MNGRFAASCRLAFFCLLGCGTSHAAESPIAPVLDDDAYLVARVDLEKLQVPPLFAVLDKVVGLSGLPSEQALERFVTRLRDAGGKEIFFVWGGGSAGFAFVPLAPGANAATIQAALADSPLSRFLAIETTDQLAGGVFGGGRSMLLELRNLKAGSRPHLVGALAATSGSTLQILLLPNDKNRRFIEGFAWYLVRADAAAAAVKQVAWASIGIDGPPDPRLKIVVEANEPGTVDGLEAALNLTIEPLLTHPAVRRNVALVDNLRKILHWHRTGNRLSLDVDDRQGDLTIVARGMIQPVLETTLTANARAITMNQLKQIGVALQNHHDVYKCFPAPAILDPEGKPLLSWRVAILPFIEEGALYQKFHLDEPWDSPHNKALLAEMPQVYRCSLAKVADDHTVYLTPRGDGSVFAGPEGTSIRQIIDGTSKTIALVEADDEHAVPWTRPDDWPFDPDQPTAGLGGHFPDVFLIGACDGAVHAVNLTIDADTMRSLISRDGREPVAFPQ
ncbi:MAG: DUF1559 domain-containing protein [Pirellulales bacterium]